MNAPEVLERRPITSAVAGFVENAALESIDPAVVAAAKRSFVDAIGVAIAGSRQPGPAILCDYVAQLSATPRASLLGRHLKSSPGLAAWVNGTAADVLGWADFSVVQMNHPSAAIAPAVLALAEAERLGGRSVLLAYILGVEVSNKLAQGVKPGFHMRGWHALGVCNTFGAAAACSRLLGFDRDRIANALGIAGAEASGMKASMVTMTKSYVSGAAARNGIESALLTRQGFTGPKNVFEGRDGFLQTFGAGADGEQVLAHLGDPYEFASPGLTLKLFPSCTHTHTAIAAALNVKARHGVSSEQIASITCSVTPVVYDFLAWPCPKDAKEAKFSMQFCVAAAFLNTTVELRHFTDAAVGDPCMLELMKRVSMVISPEFAALGYNPPHAPSGCIMTIRLKDGTEHVERVEKGPWEPPNVPSRESLRQKFLGAAAPVIGQANAEKAFNVAEAIETARDMDQLMSLLRA
jgi:2-methylcitrate dehydratase PrpD